MQRGPALIRKPEDLSERALDHFRAPLPRPVPAIHRRSRSLRIVDADGTRERQLIPPTTEILVGPGGRPTTSSGSRTAAETFLVRARRTGSVVGPALPASASSPDGRWIAYTRGARELWVSSPDGSGARLVASVPNWIATGAFSPDSTRLSYAAGLGISSSASEIVGVDGTGRVRLHEAPVVGGRRLGAQWALRRVRRPERPNPLPATGGLLSEGRTGRTFGGSSPASPSRPDWSPRGDWILFQRQVRTLGEDRYSLMLVRPGRKRCPLGCGRGPPPPGSPTGVGPSRPGVVPAAGLGILEIDIFQGHGEAAHEPLSHRQERGRADNLRGKKPPRHSSRPGRRRPHRRPRRNRGDLFGGPGDDSLLARDGR